MNETPEQLKEQGFKPDRMFGLAQRIKIGEFEDLYTYCLEEDKFYIYQNGYWRSIFEIEIISRISEKFPKINKEPVGTKRQVVEQLKYLVHQPLAKFNSDDLLNFKTGMVDVTGGNVLKHEPSRLSTIRIPYNYDMLSSCPTWEKTLEEIFEGDKEKIEILQEFFGYCLTRDTRREKALLLLGESRTGKSTILQTFSHVVGDDNCSFVPLKFISNPQYTPLIINKMVNIDSDVCSKAESFEAEFKIITSGEPVTVNQKFVATFRFRPYCKLILAANTFPRITDHSSAFYKRLILIPCNRVFENEEQNINLKSLLLEELPGIFNWAVKGLHRLNKRGHFLHNKFMTDAVEELREESNPVEAFFKDFITIDLSGDNFIEKGFLYGKYSDWCKANGNHPMSSVKFGQSIYQKYSKSTPKQSQDHRTGKRIWRNIIFIENTIPKGQEIEWHERVSQSTEQRV